jgi:hypothetical protein
MLSPSGPVSRLTASHTTDGSRSEPSAKLRLCLFIAREKSEAEEKEREEISGEHLKRRRVEEEEEEVNGLRSKAEEDVAAMDV